MLPGHRRIRRADEFRSVMRGPARATSSTVIVHVGPLLQDPEAGVLLTPARAGLIVGRSVGGAVARNQVKRRLRHALMPLLADVPDGWGVVVRALPGAARASGRDLQADVAVALRRCLDRVGQRPKTPVAVSP